MIPLQRSRSAERAETLPRALALSAGLDASRTEILEQVFLRVTEEAGCALAILLGGSFIKLNMTPLDIDIVIIRPASPGFRRYVAVECIRGLKAEIFVESIDTLEERLVNEHRNNLEALGQLLLHSVNLMPPCAEVATILARQHQLAATPTPALSRALVASQFQQALDALRSTQRASDRIAISIELLQLMRQTLHALRGQRTKASLKHFLRRIEREEPAWSAELIGHFNDCLHTGRPEGLIQLVAAWMAREGLCPHDSLRLTANGIQVLSPAVPEHPPH